MKSKLQLFNPGRLNTKQLVITTASVAAIKEIPFVPYPVRNIAGLSYCVLCFVILFRLINTEFGLKVLNLLTFAFIINMFTSKR